VNLMDKIMGEMIGNMNAEEKRKALTKMVPKIMEGLGSEEMMGLISWTTEHCLSSMSTEERKKMLDSCHTMLGEMEQKFL